jgi:hypothetical protein
MVLQTLSDIYINLINIWDLVPLPPSKSVVGCRWMYKIKTNSDGLLSDTKLSWLQNDTLNSMVWIMRRHLFILQK